MTPKQLLIVLASSIWSSACLSDPELPSCADFPLGTSEACGSDCEVYCAAVVRSCPGTFEDVDACVEACQLEPVTALVEGDYEDEEGNSLECRLTYIRRGACEEANLTGNSQCTGASCSRYCDAMEEHCVGAYPTAENCLDTCQALPRGTSDEDANTVECRTKHALRAEIAPGGDECDAASMAGGGVCGGDPCEPYCDFVMRNCTGENAIYRSRGECEQFCGLLNSDGRFDDWSFELERDTLQCRIYHVGLPAVSEPAKHCPHARIYNSAHCGIEPGVGGTDVGWPCTTYCDIVGRHCPDSFASSDECDAYCRSLDEVLEAPPEGPDIYPMSTLDCPVP